MTTWRKSIAAGEDTGQGQAGASEQKQAHPAWLDQREKEGGSLSAEAARGLGRRGGGTDNT